MNNFGPSIGSLKPPALKLPSFKLPSMHPIKMPKPIHMPAAPKIASVHVTPISNGFKVQHHMTHGPKQVPFVFSDPAKMASHLARIQKSQWREPNRDPAPAITKDLNVGGKW